MVFPCVGDNLMGHREQLRRGGYRTEVAARRARDEVLGRSREEQTSRSWTVAQWLRYWLSTLVGIRPTTRLSHTQYIERFSSRTWATSDSSS